MRAGVAALVAGLMLWAVLLLLVLFTPEAVWMEFGGFLANVGFVAMLVGLVAVVAGAVRKWRTA